MVKCIVLHGPSAVGKTTIARRLLQSLGEHYRYAVIQGDFFAHLVYGCTYTADQLDLKYRNIAAVVQNVLAARYSLIVDDLFRRQEDADCLVALAIAGTAEVIPIHLTAATEELCRRNRTRDYWDWIPEEKIKSYPRLSESVTFPNACRIDTTGRTVKETLQQVMDYLQKRGAYVPKAARMLPASFTPLSE